MNDFRKLIGALSVVVGILAAIVLGWVWCCCRFYVPAGHMAIVTAKTGDPLPPGAILAEDGQKGVYVMSKQLDEASFVPVKVLLSHGDKTVVEKNYFINVEGQKVSTVENYDEILKKPPTAEEAEGSEKNAD